MSSQRLAAVTIAVLVLGSVLRLADSAVLASLSAALTDACLLVAAVGAVAVARRSARSSPQRRGWWAMAAAAACLAVGQLVLGYYVVRSGGKIVFPSAADAFLVAGMILLAGGLCTFAVTAERSGLPLGGRLGFWSPAAVVGVAALGAAYAGIDRAHSASQAPLDFALRLFYPMMDFVILAASAVMVRVALKFRGGQLLRTWLPISLGASVACISDLVFAQQSATAGEISIAGFIESLWFLSVVGLGYGVLNQLLVVRGAPAPR